MGCEMEVDDDSSWAVGWAGFAGVMIIVIGICIAVIWALTAHGRDIAA